MQRRGFLGGLLAMPAIIRTPGLLMPVRRPLTAEFLVADYLTELTNWGRMWNGDPGNIDEFRFEAVGVDEAMATMERMRRREADIARLFA